MFFWTCFVIVCHTAAAGVATKQSAIAPVYIRSSGNDPPPSGRKDEMQGIPCVSLSSPV